MTSAKAFASRLMGPSSLAALSCVLLAACGGGSGSGSGDGATIPDWRPGVFLSSETFRNECEVPRTGENPATGGPFPDVQGSTLAENNWLRSWINDLYLWYDEVEDRDPALFTTPAYFDLLKTNELTATGAKKDNFHFSIPTMQWYNLSVLGQSSGYGMKLAGGDGFVQIRLVEPDSPAAMANLARGTRIFEVDGVSIADANSQAESDTINAGLSPRDIGETHAFLVQDLGADETRIVELTSENVTAEPVQFTTTFDTASGKVGYLLFNDHNSASDGKLISAFTRFEQEGVNDLILDLRYNSGGAIDIASQVSYMIAGDTTAGEVFYRKVYNDKYSVFDPFSGRRLESLGFRTVTTGFFSEPAGVRLPTLNLSRVYVITTGGTCSASELIMNALRGINIEVNQIGGTTCGKPYGFFPTDNCGTTYFSIQFTGVNAQGFGEYSEGFAADNDPDSLGVKLNGCFVRDDLENPLGATQEGMIAAALMYRESGTCPPVPSASRATATNEKLLYPAKTGYMFDESINRPVPGMAY